jgi:hypothetical protein
MKWGKCRLCAEDTMLHHSHVWPSFAYKRYAVDQTKGGQFVDFMKMRDSNRQYKEYWFCSGCEQHIGATENYARSLCDQLETGKTQTFVYDETLLRFITSLSWRAAMFDLDSGGKGRHTACADALKKWRKYLFGLSEDVGMYSQHLFFAFQRGSTTHKRLGGQIFLEEQVVVSQVGPLIVAALLGRSRLSRRERAIWDRSRIVKGGGVVKPLDVWRVGSAITPRLTTLLASIEANAARKARDIISRRVRPPASG